MLTVLKSFGKNSSLVRMPDGRLFVAVRTEPWETMLYNSLSRVSDRNLAAVFGVIEDGEAFFALREYIDGVSLKEYVAKNGPIGEKTAKSLMLCVLSGLGALHSAGIIHRDITPANIIITPDMRAVITDYNICRYVKPSSVSDTRILGTPGFAAPEQFGFSQSDFATDIYAAGAVLNFMLTGKMLTDEKAGGRLGRIVDKCTKMDPKIRYKNTAEVKSALEHGYFSPAYLLSVLPGLKSNKKGLRTWSKVYYIFTLILSALLAFAGGATANSLISGAEIIIVFISPFHLGSLVGDLIRRRGAETKNDRIVAAAATAVVWYGGLALLGFAAQWFDKTVLGE